MTAMPYFVALLLLSQVTDSAQRYATADGNPVLAKAYIRVQDEAEISAPDAGLLMEMEMREGMRIKKDEVLGVVDPRETEARLKIAKYAELAAKKLVELDIEERYARAAAAVAKVEWEQAQEANAKHKGAVPQSELRRKKLDYERARLQIEKAHDDRIMASYDAKTKTAEREAAQMMLDMRTIRAPFDGDVVKTFVHQSEWVTPGEPILKLVRFDKLYVEGDLFADEYDRAEVIGKPVTVEVIKARGRKATVAGKIVHVDQLLMGSRSRYTVRAEVENELVNDSWLLQPGGVVRMTIHLDQESLGARVQSLEPGKK